MKSDIRGKCQLGKDENPDLFDGLTNEKYKLASKYPIYRKIPVKLYKYQPINDHVREQRLKSIKENNIWVSKATTLNDPFDCNSHYFDEKELAELIEQANIDLRTGRTSNELIENLHETLELNRKDMQICSLTSKVNNMPMWSHYADNHKGICIEYDFTYVDSNDQFTDRLFAVKYVPKRLKITKYLFYLLDNIHRGVRPNMYLLYFLNMAKHISWEYEGEWRYTHPASDTYNSSEKNWGENVNLPKGANVSAIYFGMNCREEDIKEVSACVESSTKLYKLGIKNHEFFNLDTVKYFDLKSK